MEEMTPEQRLNRAERILLIMAKSGRRTRSEWQYKINSLIDAQIRHEAESRVRSAKIDEQLRENAVAQAENRRAIAELRESEGAKGISAVNRQSIANLHRESSEGSNRQPRLRIRDKVPHSLLCFFVAKH